MTPAELIAFEADISAEFEAGKIKAPVHLAGGNEEHLIEVFKNIAPADWVLGTWRAHYHALLKGVPPDEVKAAILDGRSIALTFPKYRVLCSAIVGGIAPIAVGLAWAIRQKGGPEKVHCFLGDMAFHTGVVQEAIKYASGHDLPVHWIVEDNAIGGKNVATQEAWGEPSLCQITRYTYQLTKPFVGVGRFVPL